jgi:hypothetical protein
MVDTGLTGDFCNRPHYNPLTEKVDDAVDVELAGTIYLCESCVVNLGEVIGMISTEKADQLRLLVADAERLLEQQRDQILGMEQIINGYRTLESAGGFNPAGSLNFSDVTTQQEPSNSDSPTLDFAGADSGESQADESFDEPDSGGVSAVNVDESGERGDESDDKSAPTANVLGF